MNLLARMMARRVGLVPRNAYRVRRDIAVPADDGTELRTDVFELLRAAL